MVLPPLSIDVVSDVVCPWCYLGKRRLERALELLPEPEVSVGWHPFRLDPTIPPEGMEREAYLLQKFGDVDGIIASHKYLTAMGLEEGVEYHFDRINRSPNTVDAHRLIRWASADGLQDAMVERLFAGYFRDGVDIGDTQVLADLARDVGVGNGDIADRLAGDEDRAAVAGEIDNAYRIGVTGVPCFIIDRRYAVMGAHPPQELADAIVKAAAKPTPDAGPEPPLADNKPGR